MKYTIDKDCLKVSIDGQSEPQLVPTLLLQVSIRELHNIMVSPPDEGELNEARYADNIIIMSDSTLHTILTANLNNMAEIGLFLLN